MKLFFIALITFLFANIVFASITPGGSGSPADFPNGFTLNSGNTLDSYETDTYAANGDLSGGNFVVVKIGNKVTVMCDAVLSHASNSSPETLSGLLPTKYRPSVLASNIFDASTGRVIRMEVRTDGRIDFDYYDWAGSFSASTNIGSLCSVTYYVP